MNAVFLPTIYFLYPETGWSILNWLVSIANSG